MEISSEIGKTVEAKWWRAPSRRTVVLVAALAAALVAGIVVAVARSGGGQGPLLAEVDSGLAQPAAVGQTISISGPLVVLNSSDQPLTLDRVTLVGLPHDMYRGAYVLPWPPTTVPFTGALTYRVPLNGRTLPGVTVAPHTRAWIVAGVTAKDGRYPWTRVDIRYHNRSGSYIRHAPLVGAICGSKRGVAGSCDIPSTP
jgi:hypothetical protein